VPALLTAPFHHFYPRPLASRFLAHPCSRLHARTVGRTNTEYEAQSPLYGTNAHLHKCPHKDPETAYQASHASVGVEFASDVSAQVVTYAGRAGGEGQSKWTANDGRHSGHTGAEKVPQVRS